MATHSDKEDKHQEAYEANAYDGEATSECFHSEENVRRDALCSG
jgi:hypothetical protein